MKLTKLCAPAWMDKEYPKRAKERKLQKFYNFLKSKNIVIEFYHGTSDISWELIQRDGMMTPPTWRGKETLEGRYTRSPNEGLDKLFFTKNLPTAIRYANREVKSWDNDSRFQKYKEEKGINLDRKAEPIIIKKNVPLHYLDEIKGVIYGTSIYNETNYSSDIKRIILSEYSDEEKLSKIRSLIEDSGENYSEFTIKGAVPISREEGFQHIERMNSKEFWIKRLENDPFSYKDVIEELKNDVDILKALKNGWIKKLENDPSYYKHFPEELKSHPEIRKAYLNIDFWEMYANSSPYRPEDIPEEILQHPRIQKALTSISSWANILKILHYRIDDCPESIKRHPEIQKAYMDGVKRDLINTQFVEAFYKKVNEFSDQLKSSSFLRDIETIYWDRNLKENLYPFCDYLYRIKENSSLFNILHDALPKSWSKERVDRFIGKRENDPKEEVPKEEVTANRVFKLIKVIG